MNDTKTTKSYPAYVAAIIEERDAAQQDWLAEREKITELVKYLTSDKFSQDPTVQVVDVLTRLGYR